MSKSSDYIHGSSPDEQRRLSLLNEILNDACIKQLNLQNEQRIIDFGSGLGQFTRQMARTVGRGSTVIGIERDGNQLEQAEQLAESEGDGDLVEFREGDVFHPPLEDSEWKSFDLAHARFLLEHVPQPVQVINQMARAVRPGGRVFVADDDHGNFLPWPEPRGFKVLWQGYVNSYKKSGNDPYIGRNLVSLLHEAGLTSVENSCVFFGGSAGSERFNAVAENLISALVGARESILATGVLDLDAYQYGIDGLHKWKTIPDAALWYSVFCAEGIVGTCDT